MYRARESDSAILAEPQIQVAAPAILAEHPTPPVPKTCETSLPEAAPGSATIAEASRTPDTLRGGSAKTAEPLQAGSELLATAPLRLPSEATAAAIRESALVPVASASEVAITLPEAPPGTGTVATPSATAIISVLQELQIRVLQAVENHRVAAAPIAAAELPAPPALLTLPLAETTEPSPVSAAAAAPIVAPPTDVPVNIEETLAALVQQLSVCKLEAGYVKLLRDSMPDGELLLACLQWMVSQGNERCIDGNVRYGRIQYLYENQDGPFHRRSVTTSSGRPNG
jgi:hypothetical protein